MNRKTKPKKQQAKVYVDSALRALEGGEPEDAVFLLNLARRENVTDEIRKLIEKAKDEADIGNPQNAENLLNLIDWPTPL